MECGERDKIMFCWRKVENPEDVYETLGEMGSLFDNDIKEMSNLLDFAD
jgi:hypothetical protein